MSETYQILVIDDLKSIHEDFEKILNPKHSEAASKLDQMNETLFGKKANRSQLPDFHLQFALQGLEGVAKVKESLAQNAPFAVAFVDVQMPPGIDGIQTIEKIWEIDKEIQIVICTAYAKYTWEDIQNRFGDMDRLFILKKPFEQIEILNLATSLAKRWKINKAINEKMSLINMTETDKGPSKLENALKTMNRNIETLRVLNDKLKEQKRKSLL